MKNFTLILFSLFAATTVKVNAQNLITDSLFGTNATIQIVTTHDEIDGRFLLQPDGKIIFCGYDNGVNNDFHISMARFDQCGEMDSSFGVNGNVDHSFDFRNLAYDFLLQPDGKIVCAGSQWNSNAASAQKLCVSRYKSDGSPDSTFNATGTNALFYPGSVVGEFHSVARLPNGRILGMGNYGQFGGPGVMRFLPDGTLDLSFDGDGMAFYSSASPTVQAVGRMSGFLLQDGKMAFTAFGFPPGLTGGHYYSVRLDSTGVIDSTYGTNGIYFDNVLPSVNNFFFVASALDASERILFAYNINSTSIDILRLKSTGVQDSTFGVNGYVNYPITGTTVKSMSIMANGNILLKGEFATGFGIGFGIMLLPDGTPDTQFGANGFRTFDLNNNTGNHSLDDLLELPNGKWLVGGTHQDFIFRKYSNQSNVPHISQTGGSLFTTGGLTFQWYRNDSLISSATANNLPLTQNGSYTVMVTDGDGCTYLSSPFVVSNVGINGIEISAFNLFPNPATDEIIIQTQNNFMINEIKIANVFGSIVQHHLINNGQDRYAISLSTLQTGVYFVGIISDKKTKWIKLIKIE